MSEVLFDDRAAGAYLGGDGKQITTTTLARWRVSGTGPKFCRVGSQIRYRQSALDEYLAVRTFQSVQEADQAEQRGLLSA